MTDSKWLERARAAWGNTGRHRPDFAIDPEPGQESVWDYPRPPALVEDSRQVLVSVGRQIIAETKHSLRVLETASPPTFYLPPEDVDTSLLVRGENLSFCEWKGAATYWCLSTPEKPEVGWSYRKPFPDFERLRDHHAFYPDRVECFVDGERVRAQLGGFYGGWVTDEIVGPYKGEPGTGSW